MAKHEKSFVNFDKPYEQNIIGMRGIIIFGVGLFLLIVITFALMWVLEVQMENYAKETKDTKNPMAMSQKDNLPPEPRVQGAPGFGVDGPNGRINLELREPKAEYRELLKLWEKEWAEGQKNQQTGTVVTLPIDKAKEKFLEQNSQVKKDEAAQKFYEESQTFVSGSSAGRTMTDRRR